MCIRDSYNCDKYGEDHVNWWDAVDCIASSGYYPLKDLSLIHI